MAARLSVTTSVAGPSSPSSSRWSGSPPHPPRAASRPPAAQHTYSGGQGIAWGSCGEELPAYECATVRVPLDYDRPRGPRTELALGEIPRAGRTLGHGVREPRRPGRLRCRDGPGRVREQLGTALGGRFHVVGFDPRGVGASDPIHCFASEEQIGEFFKGYRLFPYRVRQRLPFFERLTSLWPTCLVPARGGAAAHEHRRRGP